jgi:broad specificity phosphatase PhoE
MRAQETASFLALAWNTTATIDNRFAEVPTPADLTFEDRPSWLGSVMSGSWLNLSEELQSWRQTMIDATLQFREDCVVFSHFVAINVIVGAATNTDKLISFRPGNASITLISNADKTLSVVYRGLQAKTKVN